MIITRLLRSFSTRSIVEQWFKAVQDSSPSPSTLHHDPSLSSELIKDILQRWVMEYPTKDALYICDRKNNAYQKFTFKEVYTEAMRLAGLLAGHELNLATGSNVLVVLPSQTKEPLIMQLACLLGGVCFHFYQGDSFNTNGIRHQMRTLAIDCIVTDSDHLEMIRQCTHTCWRPLKKLLIGSSSMSEPLPLGWLHLDRSTSLAKISISRHLNQWTLPHLLTANWLKAHKTPRLLWVKESQNKVSLAPWLLGATILYRDTDDLPTMLRTFESFPIDTFCASQKEYRRLDHEQPSKKIHLEQLLSTEPIEDPTVKARWQTFTGLTIQDDYPDLSATSNHRHEGKNDLMLMRECTEQRVLKRT